MTTGAFDRRPRWGALALAITFMGLPLAATFARDATAAVLCQRKKQITVRLSECKRKEVVVQDLQQLSDDVQQLRSNVQQLGTDLGTQGGVIAMETARVNQLVQDVQQLGTNVQQLGTNLGQLGTNVQQLGTNLGTQAGLIGTQTARVDQLFGSFRLECVNEPNRVKAETERSFFFDNIECSGGCRTHDGNQAACEAAWAESEDGATSCFFFKGLCLPCAGCGEEPGACTNACRVPVNVTCPSDPTRTIFAGGPGTHACEKFDNQVECEQAFHADQGLRASTCFWDGSECQGCGPRNENDQDCINTCRTIECADPTRTTLKQCDDIGNDEIACNKAWHLTGNGGGDPASCFFEAVMARCRGCGFPNELRGNCTNTCR